ncbi:MAG: tetratricopeptide repeat protein [Aquisalimonadaceae bacterium]
MRVKTGLKLLGLFILYTLCISLFWGCTSRAPDEPAATGLYEQAALVLVEGRDRKHLEQALELTTLAIEKDPDYSHALNMRAQLLLELGRPNEAVADMERLVAIKDYPEGRMRLCLVKDAAPGHEKDTNACYHAVAVAYKEAEGEMAYRNINYLIALKMANAPTFQAEADRFIAEIDENSANWNPSYDFNRELLEMDRHEVFEEFMGTTGD